jgi:hypothetical protein
MKNETVENELTHEWEQNQELSDNPHKSPFIIPRYEGARPRKIMKLYPDVNTST